MDSTRLRYFISAAQCLNFSEVARSNYISQPTISHQIGLLEQELGVDLFARHGKKLRLTSAGEFFVPIALKILNDIQSASDDVMRYKQGKEGNISILVSETCRGAYQRCLAEFSKLNTGILLDVEVTLTPVSTKHSISKECDIYFIAEKLVKNNENFDYLTTHQDGLDLVLPQDFQSPENLDDFSFLDGIPFVGLNLYDSMMIQHDIHTAFQKRNYAPQLINRYNRMDEVILSVEAGAGFSILPHSITTFHPSRRIKYIPLDDEEFNVNCVVAWRKQNQNRAAEIIVEVIKNIFG